MQNPEYYTVWNHRRRILLEAWSQPQDAAEEIERDIVSDLKLITPLMLKYPKCYWIWNYRLWLLEQSSLRLEMAVARGFWQEELGLVAKMLARDRRNFHGWRYRRMVVAELESERLSKDEQPPRFTEQEFDYTTKMIHTDLSNFSAWHYRSKLIPRLLTERKAGEQERRQMLDEGAPARCMRGRSS